MCNSYFIHMFSITYTPPYSDGVTRVQYFNTEAEALSMIDFYRSCGTPAYMNMQTVDDVLRYLPA